MHSSYGVHLIAVLSRPTAGTTRCRRPPPQYRSSSMRRRVLLCLTLITMSACNGDNVIKPTASPTAPSKDISDATHSGLSMASNPDFFFLPPMVKDASGSPLWNAGAFNAGLHPTVEICALVAADTAQATAAPCAASPTTLNATADATAEQY